jgi:thioredoxin
MAVGAWSPVQLKSKIDSGGVVLVDFKAPWCSQCGPQVRALERVASNYENKAEIGTLDLEQYNDAGEIYHVSALPTLLIFKNGQLAQEFKGYTKTPTIAKALDKTLNS